MVATSTFHLRHALCEPREHPAASRLARPAAGTRTHAAAHARPPQNPEVRAEPRGWSWRAGRMGESIPLAAPVPVEQAVLETFFSHLGIFSYDKAKDNVEKEREANKSAGGSWLSLLAALAHLAAAEKVYHSLTYLGQKLGTSAPPLPLRRKERGCAAWSAWLGCLVTPSGRLHSAQDRKSVV